MNQEYLDHMHLELSSSPAIHDECRVREAIEN